MIFMAVCVCVCVCREEHGLSFISLTSPTQPPLPSQALQSLGQREGEAPRQTLLRLIQAVLSSVVFVGLGFSVALVSMAAAGLSTLELPTLPGRASSCYAPPPRPSDPPKTAQPWPLCWVLCNVSLP